MSEDKTTELIAGSMSWREPYSAGSLIRRLVGALESEHQRAEGYRELTRRTELQCQEAEAEAEKWQKLWEKAANGVLSLQAERDALRSQIEEACVVLVAGSIPLGMTQAEFYERLVCDAFEILSRAIDTKEQS